MDIKYSPNSKAQTAKFKVEIVGSDQQAADFKAALEGKINVHICARL